MATLTPRMRELVAEADLDRGAINDVPLATMFALARRGLVVDRPGWVKMGNSRGQSTSAGRFPHYRGVKLTEAGIRAARAVKGLPR
jgi:hypothetical protein